MNEVDKSSQKKLADEIIAAVKSRLYDMSEYKIKSLEITPELMSSSSTYRLFFELPNGESISLILFTKRAEAV
jgi:hypothetical protein